MRESDTGRVMGKMKTFERAKKAEIREAFVKSRTRSNKYKPEEAEAIRNYILSDECVRDIERLEAGDYYLDYPRYRLVPKNFQNKKRAIYILDGNQALLLKLLGFALRDIESFYSDRLFSFRSDKTAKDLLFEAGSNKELGNMYVLKTDVSNYVGSIVPELLILMLEKIFMPDDPEFFHFLEWILTRNKVIDINGNVIDHCPGGLGGLPLGNIFMNIYLHEMDDYFAPRAAFYSRYSDDILIGARTYEEIKEYETKFFEFLDRLRLGTNRDKTMIVMPGEPFDLLGMEICGDRIRIAEHSMAKIKRKLRIYTKRTLKRRNTGEMSPEEAASDLIDRFNRFFFGLAASSNRLTWARWAFPVITDVSSLEEIDHYFQDSLRYVLYGSMKRRKLTVPYEKLGELGYKSLVYYYHHQDAIKYMEPFRKKQQ